MNKLDRQLNTDKCKLLAPVEVEGGICLSSDGTFVTSTSLGGNTTPLNKDLLKKILKDLAFKIIKETYAEHKQNSPDLH